MSNKDNAIKTGEVAQGHALAKVFIDHCVTEQGKLMRYMRDLYVLSLDGRKTFRVDVMEILKEWRKKVKDAEGTPEHSYFQRISRSAGVRMSEATTLSKAFDAGYNPEFIEDKGSVFVVLDDERLSYHALVGQSRLFLESQAAAGPTQKRGRKAAPDLDKAMNYILKLTLDDDEKNQLAAWVAAGCPKPESDAEPAMI